MNNYSLSIEDLRTWLHSVTRIVAASGAKVADFRETSEVLPAAAVDFDGDTMTAGVRAWGNGLFDFEIYRLSDGKLVLIKHVEVSRIDSSALHDALNEFLTAFCGETTRDQGQSLDGS